MNIRIKDAPEKNGILAGVALLVLAVGFMIFKLWSLQSQVSDLEANRKTLQTVPPSQQLSKEAERKKNRLEALRSGEQINETGNEQ